MKITKLNFKYLYPQISKTLAECQYVSLDFEFSGTTLRKELVNTRFDDPNLRYFKLKENIKNFIPLQVGLTGVKLNIKEDNNVKINLYPLNFYIFPFLPNNSDKKLMFDIGSIDFLTSNSFDFNKTFYDGIRFISLYEYEKAKRDRKVRDIIKSKKETKMSKFYPPEARLLTISFYPVLKSLVENFITNNSDYSHPDNYAEFEITFVRKILLDYFLSNLNNLFKTKINDTEEGENILFDVEIEERQLLSTVLKVKITNKKLLEQKLRKLANERDIKKITSWMYYQSLVMNESDDELYAEIWKKLLMNLHKENIYADTEIKEVLTGSFDFNSETQSQLTKIISRAISSLDNVDEYYKIGFTKVITDLIQMNKTLIFHNGILDLMHLVDKFIEPLPETFDEFKKIVNKFFPSIYDTKYLIENNASLCSIFKDSSLESVSKKIISESLLNNEVVIGDEQEYSALYSKEYSLDSKNNDLTHMKSHEAGYDSLVTAFSFIFIFKTLFKNIALMNNPSYVESCLRTFKNKLLFSSLQFPCDLNYKEKENENNQDKASRFEIFVITDLPEIITPDEIKNSFIAQFRVRPQIYKLFGQNLAYAFFNNNASLEEFKKASNQDSADTEAITPLKLQGYQKENNPYNAFIIHYEKFKGTIKVSSEENFERIMKEIEAL